MSFSVNEGSNSLLLNRELQIIDALEGIVVAVEPSMFEGDEHEYLAISRDTTPSRSYLQDATEDERQYRY